MGYWTVCRCVRLKCSFRISSLLVSECRPVCVSPGSCFLHKLQSVCLLRLEAFILYPIQLKLSASGDCYIFVDKVSFKSAKMGGDYSATSKAENVDTSTTASQEDNSLAPGQTEKDVGTSDGAIVVNNEPTADEYPHGLRLISLVLAINLAMFLASLDQVSHASRTELRCSC